MLNLFHLISVICFIIFAFCYDEARVSLRQIGFIFRWHFLFKRANNTIFSRLGSSFFMTLVIRGIQERRLYFLYYITEPAGEMICFNGSGKLTISWYVQFHKIFEVLNVGWKLVDFIVAQAKLSESMESKKVLKRNKNFIICVSRTSL